MSTHAIKKVAIAGAGGNLGPSVLKALLLSKLFSITVLTRPSSKNNFPSTVNVVPVDYTSPSSLSAALAGHDALVSIVGAQSLLVQEALIDAAIAAGVKRFIPSEFGSDTHHPKVKPLPVYQNKLATRAVLTDRAANGLISYTEIITGPFLDWNATNGLLADVKGKKVQYVDGGDVRFSCTTREHIGTAVLGVLTHLEETKNRAVYVKNYDVSQREVVDISKKLLGSEGWVETNVKSDDLEAEAWADLKAQKFDGGLWVKFIFKALFGVGYGGVYEAKDNALLGVPEFGKAELEETIKGVIEEKENQ